MGGSRGQFGNVKLKRSIRYLLIADGMVNFIICQKDLLLLPYRRRIHAYLIALNVIHVVGFALCYGRTDMCSSQTELRAIMRLPPTFFSSLSAMRLAMSQVRLAMSPSVLVLE